MGKRGLLRAVDQIVGRAARKAAKPFGQIDLAAPNVDGGLFRSLASAYLPVGAHTTLYKSVVDLAIRASRLFHGAPRIGFTPPMPIIDGIDTIKVTGADLTLLGFRLIRSQKANAVTSATPERKLAASLS